MNLKKYNPCESESIGNPLADFIYSAVKMLNTGADHCECCTFIRGGAIFFLIGLTIGTLL